MFVPNESAQWNIFFHELSRRRSPLVFAIEIMGFHSGCTVRILLTRFPIRSSGRSTTTTRDLMLAGRRRVETIGGSLIPLRRLTDITRVGIITAEKMISEQM